MRRFKKGILRLICLVLGFISGCIVYKTYFFYRTKPLHNNNKVFKLAYRDSFDVENLQIVSDNSNEVLTKKDTLFLCINPNCNSCREYIDVIHTLEFLLRESSITLGIIWTDEPLNDELYTSKLKNIPQFMSPKITISTSSPFFFMLNNNKINFRTEDVSLLISHLIDKEFISQEQLITKSNKYLMSITQNQDPTKDILVYFAMENCSDCKRMDSLLKENKIYNKFNMIKIYTEDSYNQQDLVDVKNLFAHIYDIKWYPSFLKIGKNEVEIIHQESDETVLKKLKQQ